MQSGWNRCGDRFKNLGNDMLGRDEVDVVTTLALKVEHKLGDLLRWVLRADGLLLMSQFWQKTQRRLHRLKKIVPDPFQPRRQSSSPKWAKELATRA